MKLSALLGTWPDIPCETSCKDGSGKDRLLQQILKQGMGAQPLQLFGSTPARADEGAVWPGAMSWFRYSKETVPEGTWILQEKINGENVPANFCASRGSRVQVRF